MRCRRAFGILAVVAPAAAAFIIFHAGCAPRPSVQVVKAGPPPIFAVHVLMDRGAAGGVDTLEGEIPALARAGVNLIIIEVDYSFEYESHPELRGKDPLSKSRARALAGLCRRNGIRLVPEFQSLGHQSWEGETFSLLTRYPELDETPGKFPANNDIYCRSWCPLHPDLNPIIFSLYDELIDAFEADGFHVGMDEVFLIADKDCPRCGGKDPAELFAGAVNAAYGHLVRDKGVEMFMWADRLIDGGTCLYGEWEASMNGTWPAVDKIPRDIILCDWHYERAYEKMRETGFPSVPVFLDKGFRVLPCSFKDTRAVRMLINDSFQYPTERMLGHMNTSWGGAKPGRIHESKSFKTIARELRKHGLKSGR